MASRKQRYYIGLLMLLLAIELYLLADLQLIQHTLQETVNILDTLAILGLFDKVVTVFLLAHLVHDA